MEINVIGPKSGARFVGLFQVRIFCVTLGLEGLKDFILSPLPGSMIPILIFIISLSTSVFP